MYQEIETKKYNQFSCYKGTVRNCYYTLNFILRAKKRLRGANDGFLVSDNS